MRIGIVREVKPWEHRVAVTPAGVTALVEDGHEVLVEVGAGEGSRMDDDQYRVAGAISRPRAGDVWEAADLIVKVKEPQPEEFGFLRPDLTLFTYLHLAAYPHVAEALIASGCTAIAYETMQADDGSLPLLAPMSEIAGRMATQVGAHHLERSQGGRGVLLGGATGADVGRVVVIGAGVAGTAAAGVALGLGADVVVLDVSRDRMQEVDRAFQGRVLTRTSTPMDVAEMVASADLVVGAVLVPGARAPLVLSAEQVRTMPRGSVVVDIAIDQGGCFETSRETSHSEPTYVVDDVIHYCVGNIPGAVPRTSTLALTHASLPFVRTLAAKGVDGATSTSPMLARGLNVVAGAIVHSAVRKELAA